MQDMLPMTEESVSSLDRVAEGVAGLRTVMVNLYSVQAPDKSWVLIDTGLPYSAGRILRWAEHQFGPGAAPSAIILTHGHFDHVGSLQDLLHHWPVPVYAHPLEMPYLTGRSPYPPPDSSVGGGAFSSIAALYPRGPIHISRSVRPLPEDGSVPGLPGWRWIHTPGHTPGHVSLFRELDRVLIAGDAFVTTKQESLMAVATQRPELHGPPAYYTSDWEAAELSVQRLAALMPAVLATGHGIPMSGPKVGDGLEELAVNFAWWGMPAQGRYVHHPAVSDERGIVTLPPPVPHSPLPALITGAALLGGLWLLGSRERTRQRHKRLLRRYQEAI